MIPVKNKLYNTLVGMQQELSPRKDVLKKGIDNKLKRSMNNYNENIQLNIDYILSRSNYSTIKALKRYIKKGEDNEEKYNWGFIEIN